ncbi:MAG: hypothetical protein JO041_16480 [Acidobacteria bacterium]|nr:hypothetical protein [Acidobacteriota bacterium]
MTFGQTIAGYFWWTYPRGSVHYDVMVTLILLFIFVTPSRVFHDKPVVRTPHQTEVVVDSDGANRMRYRVAASAVQPGDDAEIRQSLRAIIEPISGEVELTRVEIVRDKTGRITEYRAWATRP